MMSINRLKKTGRWFTGMLALVLFMFVHRGAMAADSQLLRRWDFDSAEEAKGWGLGHDLADLTVAAGKLRMRITGVDAYLFAPLVEAPLDGCTVRIRLRCDRDGVTQIYWRSTARPGYGQDQQSALPTAGAPADAPDGGFQTIEFEIGTPADAGQKLTGFRIDPFNDNTDGIVEIDFVELVRKPPLIRADFTARTPRIKTGEEVELSVKLQQLAGQAVEGPAEFQLAERQQRETLQAGTPSATVSAQRRLTRPGVHHERAKVQADQGRFRGDLETSVIVGEIDQLPVTAGLRTDRLRLDLVRTTEAEEIGAARWQIAGRGAKSGAAAEWRLAGWLLPLARITVEQEPGRIVQREPAMKVVEHSDRRVRLEGGLADLTGWRLQIELKIEETNNHQYIQLRAVLNGPQDGRLLEFAVPVVRVERDNKGDLLDRFALFGGLEFLEPGWPSSSVRAVGERFAKRWSPHPFKITLPVMAVEQGELTTSLMWTPLEKWNGTDTMPTATFASPNCLEDQPNHLMKLSVPTIPRWSEENETYARQAYVMKADQPVTLGGVLSAESDLPVAMTARLWYEIFGAPPPPPKTHENKELYDLLARHLGETMYWPDEQGWRYHWYMEAKSHFSGWMAAELLAHSIETAQREWVQLTALAGKRLTIIDTAGTLEGYLKNDGAARAYVASMRPDGTWPFVHTAELREKVRKITDGKYDSLGEDNSTSLGTCVQAALPILRYAELTGDKACLSAAAKALEAMRRFRVPRGAQVWEVHQDIPDIRAAALAVEAFQIGYHLTGNKDYLDEAQYWAWTGVPFLYSWHVPIETRPGAVIASRDREADHRTRLPLAEAFQNPARQITPYGTVPVLGPTFYVVNWFGVIVQWCGLEWAAKVIDLGRDRPDPLLRRIADGVVASGLQQMFDRPPWVGLYPDVWDTRENIAQGAFICARLPIECLQAQGRIPGWTRTWTRVVSEAAGGQRWHVSGWGEPISLDSPVGAGSWMAKIRFVSGEPNELIIAGVEKPQRVLAGRRTIDWESGPGPLKKEGWYYYPDRRAVIARFTQSRSEMEIRVEW